jgi:hypothetical protein
MAEFLLVKYQLLILSRSRQRTPNLRLSDRMAAGWCALFLRPSRLIRSAIALKPSTLLHLHHVLIPRKYRLLFSPKGRRKERELSSVNRPIATSPQHRAKRLKRQVDWLVNG